ncbi:MAG: tetratricopeptide repeat protein, partial [Cyanobacteria bacterium P01_C01_bin.89]
MDEQRMKDYLALIQRLVNCPSGEEPAILQGSSELVDMGLVQVMVGVAEQLAAEGQENPAAFLKDMAGQLGRMLDGEAGPRDRVPIGDSFGFLMQLFQLILSSRGDAQQVYPFLKANVQFLDQRLLLTIQAFWEQVQQESQEKRQFHGMVIGEFANLIQQFPLGDRPLNMDMAIAAYEIVAQVFDRQTNAEVWATIQNNLAAALSDRIRGDRADNLERSIASYEQALLVYTREDFPVQWATTQNNLANALNNRIRGDRADNLERSITSYEQALLVRTREDFPVDWAMTQNNLAAALSERIRGDRADNL